METRFFSILVMGFLLGLRHATDADHVVAVTAMMARYKKLGRAWILGAFWGLGHTVTIFLVGAAIIVFKVHIAPRVGLALEFLVGVVLVILGVANLKGKGLGLISLPGHEHEHDPEHPEHCHEIDPVSAQGPHAHWHFHEISFTLIDRWIHGIGIFQALRAVIVGIVHGLAGSAAVALLVLSALPNPRAGIFYLVIFSLGSMMGMMTMSALFEFSVSHLVRRWIGLERFLILGTGALSLLFGIFVIYQSGLKF